MATLGTATCGKRRRQRINEGRAPWERKRPRTSSSSMQRLPTARMHCTQRAGQKGERDQRMASLDVPGCDRGSERTLDTRAAAAGEVAETDSPLRPLPSSAAGRGCVSSLGGSAALPLPAAAASTACRSRAERDGAACRRRSRERGRAVDEATPPACSAISRSAADALSSCASSSSRAAKGLSRRLNREEAPAVVTSSLPPSAAFGDVVIGRSSYATSPFPIPSLRRLSYMH